MAAGGGYQDGYQNQQPQSPPQGHQSYQAAVERRTTILRKAKREMSEKKSSPVVDDAAYKELIALQRHGWNLMREWSRLLVDLKIVIDKLAGKRETLDGLCVPPSEAFPDVQSSLSGEFYPFITEVSELQTLPEGTEVRVLSTGVQGTVKRFSTSVFWSTYLKIGENLCPANAFPLPAEVIKWPNEAV